ncbi:MAG: hypothetical protein DRJ05_06180 [Bacteroidetes bacterium]|nr:MAG: hypothetical protein DRJ05_06180 [Bacteroidota bacterium]
MIEKRATARNIKNLADSGKNEHCSSHKICNKLKDLSSEIDYCSDINREPQCQINPVGKTFKMTEK